VSTVLWRVQPPRRLSVAVASSPPSGAGTIHKDVPSKPGSESLSALSFDRSDANALQNSGMPSPFAIPRGRGIPCEATPRLGTSGFPTVRGFHEVSCLIV
jgi:hypothetical protein